MCLFTNIKPHKADKPIKCLKLVRKITDMEGNVSYIPLYIGLHGSSMKYVIGQRAEMLKDKYEPEGVLARKVRGNVIGRFPQYNLSLHEGLHTFLPDVDDWESVAAWAMYYYEGKIDLALLECEIPAGTDYCYGLHNCLSSNNGERGYVSEYLDVIKEVDVDWSRIQEIIDRRYKRFD